MTPVSDGIMGMAPGGLHHQGPDAPSAHRRPGYPSSGCVPAEPDSVSPGPLRVAVAGPPDKSPSDTGVMPPKSTIRKTSNIPSPPHRIGEVPGVWLVYNPLRRHGQM